MKYQPNIPTDLYNKFIENLGYTPKDEKILVIRDIYTACYLSINNEVTFVSDDSEAISMFVNTVIVNPEFDTNNKHIFIEENNEKKWLSTINEIDNNLPINKETGKKMKFNVAIMNPPYDKNLHLKILEKVIPIANKVINISPVRWLQDPLAKYKEKNDYHRFQKTISDKIESLDIISSDIASNIFGAAFNMNLGIYKIAQGGYDYNQFSNVIVDKILLKIPDNIANHTLFSIPNKWSIVMSLMCGGSGGRLATTSYWNNDYDRTVYFNNKRKDGLTYKEYRETTCWGNNKPKAEAYHLEFDTEEELKNFYNSLQTKVFRYLFTQTLVDIHPHPEFYMYMNDYTQAWTDKRFCEYFEITGYIDDEHAEPNSEWETILKTIEQYEK